MLTLQSCCHCLFIFSLSLSLRSLLQLVASELEWCTSGAKCQRRSQSLFRGGRSHTSTTYVFFVMNRSCRVQCRLFTPMSPSFLGRYLADPFLINSSKFDLRVYVYVTSFEPLRIYIYHEGLARFATCKYSHSMQSLSNRFAHLTNYSINKRNAAFTPNSDETVCQGHKWWVSHCCNNSKR